MAKRGVLEHRKTFRLAKELQIPRYAALGLLEGFWHWAAKNARTGRLHSGWEEEVADYLRLDKSPEELKEALLESKWLDSDPKGEVIHDWWMHADEAVKKTLANNFESFDLGWGNFREPFAKKDRNETESVAPNSTLPEPEPVPVPEPDNTPQAPKGEVVASLEKPDDPDSRATIAVVARIAAAFLRITGRKFQALPTAAIWKNLRARVNAVRISERTAFEAQCIEVIELKTSQWKGNPDMERHLNPETLFRPGNLEKYLVEVGERASSQGAPSPGYSSPESEPEEPVNGRDYVLKAEGKQVLKLVPGTDQPFDEEAWRASRRAS